jgi:hypothetical protein
MIIDYPFIKAGVAESRPALFIRLICPSSGCFQDSIGLIDTGATGCCVPAHYSKILKLDLTKGLKRDVITANGTNTAYEHKCQIKVWDSNEYFKDKKVLVYEKTEVPVLFTPHLNEILLGVSFLNDKVLTINYGRKVFSLNDN